VELLRGIHLVDGVTSNVFLIVEPDGLSVVDTGIPGSGPKIIRYIQSIGRASADLRRILLTHQHVDHVGGAAALAAETGADVFAHAADIPAIEGAGPRDLPHGPLRPIFRWFVLPRIRPVGVTQPLHGGETLPVLAGDGGLQVIEAPGHTLGEVVFYLPGRRLLFGGDALGHRGDRITPSPAMFNRDTAQTQRSFAMLAQSLAIEASLCGHGNPILQGAGSRMADTARRLPAPQSSHQLSGQM
jgi:glyoxylase-like metal-dependent hydrolase (beta-lactamase superfamily II)